MLFSLHCIRKGILNLMVSGIIMMVLAPVIGFSSGTLFLHFWVLVEQEKVQAMVGHF